MQKSVDSSKYTVLRASRRDFLKTSGVAVGGAVAGALLGSAQQRYLRRLTLPADWWVLASTVGGAMGGAVASLIVDDAMIFAVLFVVSGASVGIAQWLVLRRQVAQAGWWVLASTLGGCVVGGQIQTMKTLGDTYIILELPIKCGAMAFWPSPGMG